jgi:two-component system cell cycle sensor histidine kinase/response regulator CckA
VELEQAILNLVINAKHAMNEGGELEINVKNTDLEKFNSSDYMVPKGEIFPMVGSFISIEISDTGCGIKKENITKIFDPFYTTKDMSLGTGLGLSTVYGLIKQFGGHIMVKSEEKIGTTFVIMLPSFEKLDDSKKEHKIAPQVSNLTDHTDYTIVLVEDENAIRIFAKKVLTNKGYNVVDYPSAIIAYDEIMKNKLQFDLIISDVLMPEMNGTSLITKLSEHYPDIKTIFISGYAEEVFANEYGENRNFNFLPKPFALKDLLSAVKKVLEEK